MYFSTFFIYLKKRWNSSWSPSQRGCWFLLKVLDSYRSNRSFISVCRSSTFTTAYWPIELALVLYYTSILNVFQGNPSQIFQRLLLRSRLRLIRNHSLVFKSVLLILILFVLRLPSQFSESLASWEDFRS